MNAQRFAPLARCREVTAATAGSNSRPPSHSNHRTKLSHSGIGKTQLQAHAFKHETERLVNELKRSSESAEAKLEMIEERSESLLQNSYHISDSLKTTGIQIQQAAQTSRKLEDHMDTVLNHSEEVYEQSRRIETSQLELQEAQLKLRRSLEEGMEMLQNSYKNLDQEMDGLRDEAIEMENEITKVGDAVFLKMTYLQSTADDIGNMAWLSLNKQQELLDAQSIALSGLHSLSKVQSEALEESGSKLQQLAEYGHRQQEELLQRQKQLQQFHDRLMENSQSILAAQQSFESKQANIFIALDKLFTLHNAMLLESKSSSFTSLQSLSSTCLVAPNKLPLLGPGYILSCVLHS